MGYCYGDNKLMSVTELKSKEWHDSDLYFVKCKKCGSSVRALARRPSDIAMKCNEDQECSRNPAT